MNREKRRYCKEQAILSFRWGNYYTGSKTSCLNLGFGMVCPWLAVNHGLV